MLFLKLKLKDNRRKHPKKV